MYERYHNFLSVEMPTPTELYKSLQWLLTAVSTNAFDNLSAEMFDRKVISGNIHMCRTLLKLRHIFYKNLTNLLLFEKST